MKVRSLVVAFATAAAASGFLATTATPAHAGTACPSSDGLPASVSGNVTPTDPQHWWSLDAAGPKIVTLVPTMGDPDLKIVSADCGTVVCYPYALGTEVCTIPAGSYNVGVIYYSGVGGSAGYQITVTSPECSDGLDNDRDGKTDYPADQGCTSAADTSEGVACTTSTGATVCVGLSPGGVWQEVQAYSVSVTPSKEHTVVGYARTYRFTVANTSVNVLCVDPAVDGVEVSPCRNAGGVKVADNLTLTERVNEYDVTFQEATLARVCHAELQATVNGLGIASAPAFTLC